jgi:hypothetical protein
MITQLLEKQRYLLHKHRVLVQQTAKDVEETNNRRNFHHYKEMLRATAKEIHEEMVKLRLRQIKVQEVMLFLLKIRHRPQMKISKKKPLLMQ